MKKKFTAFATLVVFMLSLSTAAYAFGNTTEVKAQSNTNNSNWKASYTAEELATLKNRELKDRLRIAGKTYNDEDLPPVIKEGRVLIPVRAITRGMGADIDWNESTKTVIITRGDVTVTMKLGESFLTVSGGTNPGTIQMDTLVQVMSNRTFVPLRFLAEAFGDRCNFNHDTGDIDVQIRLATPAQPVLSSNIATWNAVANENNGYQLRLFRNNSEVSNVTIAHGSALNYNFSTLMTASGIYTVKVKALGSGDYINSYESIASLPQLVGVTALAAPTNPVVNDTANTFGWTNVPGYSSISYYEYSVDNGSTWNDCTANPQSVGNYNFATGTVKVRIEADFSAGRVAGMILASTDAFTVSGQTVLATPAAPTLVSNIATWTAVANENDGYKLRLFRNDVEVTTVTIAHGVAMTYDFSTFMNTSGVYTVKVTALGTGAYTDSMESAASLSQNVNMVTPAAPTNPVVNDTANTFGWTNAPGYSSISYYEYSVNNGSTWNDCTANPQSVGNHNFAAGTVQVRVKANLGQNRLAGVTLVSTDAFTISD